jgi:HD-GYP domain-containing protein (c-di-GMP phosphodiesterase class II)
MSLEERRVEVTQLAAGMFVCRLDRPWTETPFPLQGFMVQSADDIATLRQYCQHVWIDVEKCIDQGPRGLLLRLGYRPPAGGGGAAIEPVHYPNATPVDEELPRAEVAWHTVRAFATRCIDDIRAGRRVAIEEVAETIEPVVASVVRNPDAYFWLEALRKRDTYAYSHAINCCALAATFGRQLGFPREVLVDLSSGGMLMDIGMAAIDDSVCHHGRPLDVRQRLAMQQHVALGLERLEAAGLASGALTEMIGAHHERHDGSGYPQGLAAPAIPLSGRILGIVDTFDSLCSERPHRPALSKHHALQALYRERDRLFQAELLEQFSQALGVYPTGSLVELTTGEVAVVMAQNIARRLFPRVTVLTRPDKTIDAAFRQVDLWADATGGARPSIARALPSGAYGLDLSEFYL